MVQSVSNRGAGRPLQARHENFAWVYIYKAWRSWPASRRDLVRGERSVVPVPFCLGMRRPVPEGGNSPSLPDCLAMLMRLYDGLPYHQQGHC